MYIKAGGRSIITHRVAPRYIVSHWVGDLLEGKTCVPVPTSISGLATSMICSHRADTPAEPNLDPPSGLFTIS